ncbi:MAG: ImmA/IrrE family metallo-endopeptidase, partial [Floccifex sp.]
FIANEILIKTRVINDFPFEIKKLVKEQSDIVLCSFKKASEKYGINIESFGSESAVWQEMDGMNIIFYNQNEVVYRIRFSIAHEFAHYLLNHETNLDKESELYRVQEVEANALAAQLLMPYQLLDECIRRGKVVTKSLIASMFGTSPDASSKRKKTMQAISNFRWRNLSDYDDIILFRYGSKVEQYVPKTMKCYDFDDEYEMQKERDSWQLYRN